MRRHALLRCRGGAADASGVWGRLSRHHGGQDAHRTPAGTASAPCASHSIRHRPASRQLIPLAACLQLVYASALCMAAAWHPGSGLPSGLTAAAGIGSRSGGSGGSGEAMGWGMGLVARRRLAQQSFSLLQLLQQQQQQQQQQRQQEALARPLQQQLPRLQAAAQLAGVLGGALPSASLGAGMLGLWTNVANRIVGGTDAAVGR
eukprot:364355-Chlamydomonas_euryale.AAC.16